jgi:hypothetical protein
MNFKLTCHTRAALAHTAALLPFSPSFLLFQPCYLFIVSAAALYACTLVRRMFLPRLKNRFSN